MVRSIGQKNWLGLESKIYQTLKNRGLKGSRILICVSGGADSVALLKVLSALSHALSFELAIAHIHHGKSKSKKQGVFRNSARKFCEKLGKKFEIPFFSTQHLGEVLSGEAALRHIRHEQLEALRVAFQFDYLALAHHQEDLLETRLIRLIRGVGPGGIGSMSLVSGKKLRPFLKVSKKELLDYLKEKDQSFLQDPSNDQLDPLRNWVRGEWLPLLEKKRPGSQKSLARSLDILTRRAKSETQPLSKFVTPYGLDRSELLTVGTSEQRQILALFLKERGVQTYSASQIDEVLKRLNSPRRDFAFVVVKRQWNVSSQFVQLDT